MRIRRSKLTRLLALLAALLVLSSCAGVGQTGIAQGWAGGTVADGILFVGSMEGKVIALDPSDGSLLGRPVSLEAKLPSGGLLGCTPGGTTAVAIYGSPVFNEDQGLVYVGGYDGKVYAFVFAEDGLRQEPRWVYPRQGGIGGAIIGGLTISHDKVFFTTSSGGVYALDAADGFVVDGWPFNTGDKIWSAPVVAGDTLYVGGFDKKLYALNVADGTQKWEPYETGGTITSTPVVHDGRVFVGSFDRHVYAVDTNTGELLWKFPSGDYEQGTPQGWFWATPVVKNDILYAPNLDGKVYALDTRTGTKVAEFDLGNPISSAPVLVGDILIVATSTSNRAAREGAVYALNTTNNRQELLLDLKENVYAPLFASDGMVYVHTMANNLYRINIETGDAREFKLATDGGD